MLNILSTRRFAIWTALFKTWLKQQLDAIAESIDFGPVEEKIDKAENKIGVADVVDLGLPVSKENGFCAIDDDNDFKPVDTDISSTQTNNYQVGSIIKPTTLGSDYEEYVVPKTVSDVPTDIWYNDSEGILNGVLTQIVWEVGKYYRVTGIYDCYNEDKTEVIDHIFTYEEVSEETVAKLISNISIDTSDLAKEATLNSVGLDAAAAKNAAQNAETTAQGTANKNEILAAIAANAGIPTLTIPDSTAAQELTPNTLYIFATRTSTLTLTLGTPIVGIANEYHFFVVCGSTAPTINFPTGITWNGGSTPTIAADKTYEVSILNNVAAYFEV